MNRWCTMRENFSLTTQLGNSFYSSNIIWLWCLLAPTSSLLQNDYMDITERYNGKWWANVSQPLQEPTGGRWGGGKAQSTGGNTDGGQQRHWQAKGEMGNLCSLNRTPDGRVCVMVFHASSFLCSQPSNTPPHNICFTHAYTLITTDSTGEHLITCSVWFADRQFYLNRLLVLWLSTCVSLSLCHGF